jgi:hypothetical protein
MTEKKRKTLFWVFKLTGIFISCLLPIWAICERYPLWTVSHGVSQSIGAGSIIILIVVVVIFHKTILNFLKERLNLRHAPPITIWLVMLIISYVLMFLAKFLYDMTMIFWMGLIGCGIGTVLTFIAENKFGYGRTHKKQEIGKESETDE